MSGSHMYVDISFDKISKISFIDGFRKFTSVTGRIKYPVALASVSASVCVIFNTDVEYAVSFGMGVLLLVNTIFSKSSLSSSMARRENVLL